MACSKSVYHLTNERTGSQIDLFGMIHIGQPSYYEAVHDLTNAMVRSGQRSSL